MRIRFSAPVIEWRGPAPFHFLRLTDDATDEVRAVAAQATYGWGCIPVRATCGVTTWTTSLMPRQGGYMLPLRNAVREAESLGLGDQVAVTLDIAL